MIGLYNFKSVAMYWSYYLNSLVITLWAPLLSIQHRSLINHHWALITPIQLQWVTLIIHSERVCPYLGVATLCVLTWLWKNCPACLRDIWACIEVCLTRLHVFFGLWEGFWPHPCGDCFGVSGLLLCVNQSLYNCWLVGFWVSWFYYTALHCGTKSKILIT